MSYEGRGLIHILANRALLMLFFYS